MNGFRVRDFVAPWNDEEPSLRANGSRECAPDDKLREAIMSLLAEIWIASSLRSSQ
jgi:hypothetical protein